MKHIVLLRAVNLGPHNAIAMADLREFAVKLGFPDAKTLLASGNLTFGCHGKTTSQLEQLLEKEAAKRLGLQTNFFVRTDAEWKAIIENNPFPKQAKNDPGRLIVGVMKDGERDLEPLRAAIVGREIVEAAGKQLYIVYPDGQGRSRLTIALIEKKLGTRVTGRNWNTVLKLDHVV